MPDNQNFIDVHPEFEELSEQCELLKEELAVLFAEWDHLTKAVLPNIEADYVVKTGKLQYGLLQVRIRVQRLKRHIDILQAAVNRGEAATPEQVEKQLDREFQEWQEKLQVQYEQIKDAEMRLSSLMSAQDGVDLRKLYRQLAKKLHPDVNPDQSDDAKNLWLQVQSAYEMGDLKQLQALSLLADDIPESYDLPNSVDLLKARRNQLKDQIKATLEKIAEVRKHPLFEWRKCLEDPGCVTHEQALIQEQIEQAKSQQVALESVLESLKQGGGNE